ncbi:serine/threonine-protein kinase [Streptomyces tsukubensis]|uniref:Serine/threonine protein kinase n=1 Tax=Streptomyces tsukubensis TaxID=83656 RepID=A0A1V3ZYW8_9ACTN|nr:serine/threonine-protein kinase [Streptomyces tsukubensis]OON71642.1 serine/threonine protein kinase [Streptomyces tsukubensis]QFR95088.1 PQQ-binding-like beta-propeller repeat protein [Streptomyces tsukubensis]
MPPRTNAARPDAGAEPPEQAGQYRLLSRLGSGGMGVVHLARSASGLTLAVKVVHPQHANDPEFRDRFRQEVAAARKVSGAFTASVVDADPDAERPWMATLHVAGPTLAEHVKAYGPLPAAQVRHLAAGLAEALRDIHRAGVVHRDLKPSNVLLAEDTPKVIDFGISRPFDSQLHTETGKLIGTPPFMAPEQFSRPREVGPAADVFALGSVLVHAATGRGPFDSDSPYIVAYQVVHDEPDLNGMPADLVPIVARCLAKEPGDRPAPDELMAELRGVAALYDTQSFVPAPRPSFGSVSWTGAGPYPDAVPRQRAGEGRGHSGGTNRLDKGGGDRGGTGADADTSSGYGGGGGSEGGSGARARRGRRRILPVCAAGAVLTVGAVLAVAFGGAGDPAGAGSGRTGAVKHGGEAFRAWHTVVGAKGHGRAMTFCSAEYAAAEAVYCARAGVLAAAVDPSDGHIRWQRDGGAGLPATPVMAGGLLHVVTPGAKRLVALDPASGRTRWTKDLAPYDGQVTSAGSTVLLTSPDGTVTGVDAATGKTRWSGKVDGDPHPHFTYHGRDGLAYTTAATSDGSGTLVGAVDPESGATRWQHRFEGQLTPFGSWDGSVYLLALDDASRTVAVVRYDPSDRTTHRVALRYPLAQGRATVRDSTVYLLGEGGALLALDMREGRESWRLDTSVSRGSTPVMDGGHVYFTAADGRLIAVDAREGRLLGQTGPRLGAADGTVVADVPAPVITQRGQVYASAPDGTVFGVDGRDPGRW